MRVVCESFAYQMHIDGLFNADPHPGNILLQVCGAAQRCGATRSARGAPRRGAVRDPMHVDVRCVALSARRTARPLAPNAKAEAGIAVEGATAAFAPSVVHTRQCSAVVMTC